MVNTELTKNLGITKSAYGRIFSFVDFGNVNYWFENDTRDAQGKDLPEGSKLVVGIKDLSTFLKSFSTHNRFYFGLDQRNIKSIRIISLARETFTKVITKPIQNIRHYIDASEEKITTRLVEQDRKGKFIYIPKCNFDVEICVDAIRFLPQYDTFCLFSGDADFAFLLDYIKRNKKKVIIFSAGYVSKRLTKFSDLNINSQKIKEYVTFVKQKSRL